MDQVVHHRTEDQHNDLVPLRYQDFAERNLGIFLNAD